MIRTRLIGVFAGLILTSAMAACSSSDDSGSTPTAGNAGASGHAGASTAGKSGGTSKAGNAGNGGSGEVGNAGVGNEAGEAGNVGLAGAAGEPGVVVTPTTFKIHAQNMSATSALPTAFSPGVAVLHTTANPFFTKDAVDRAQGLGSLASDADPTALFAAIKTAAGIDSATLLNIPTGAAAAAALQPGEAYDLVVAAIPGEKLSFVSMFGESNDAFFAPTGAGIALFDDNGVAIPAHDVTDQISLWDAGVEKDEAPGLGPTQKPRQSANGAGSAEGVASKRVDTTRALPLAQGVVSFTVTASGTGPLNYQWRKGGTNLNNGGNVSGATSSALALSAVQTNDAGLYQVVVTNVAGAAFSYGAAKARVKAQFRDAHSPYQLRSSGFAMCLVDITDSGRDITVAKFQEEKDRREISMASYRLWTGVNAQIDPKVIIQVSVEKKSDKVYLVTSKEVLPQGEFILFTIIPDVAAMTKANTPTSLGGYDFGHHEQ